MRAAQSFPEYAPLRRAADDLNRAALAWLDAWSPQAEEHGGEKVEALTRLYSKSLERVISRQRGNGAMPADKGRVGAILKKMNQSAALLRASLPGMQLIKAGQIQEGLIELERLDLHTMTTAKWLRSLDDQEEGDERKAAEPVKLSPETFFHQGLVTISGVMVLLGVSRSYASRLVRSGKFCPHIKMGYRFLFRPAELSAWLAQSDRWRDKVRTLNKMNAVLLGLKSKLLQEVSDATDAEELAEITVPPFSQIMADVLAVEEETE